METSLAKLAVVGICLMLVACPATDVIVPDLYGMSEADAMDAIEAAGLFTGTITDITSDTVPVGQVATQGLAAGSIVPAGSTLAFSVSLGPDTYDNGYEAGFAQDDWYWQGYDDSFDTLGFSPIYYQGSTIPEPTSPEYDRGYYDGIWYAYNDGYFVDYDYAFTIGFSEGYDAAFFSGYLAFLAADEHVEYLNGGWDDGYNDGFSEGRVFGANDYEQGWPFNWVDALDDYRSGTDLNFDEINVGTGAYGPVILYEYGTDPAAKASSRGAAPFTIRNKTGKAETHAITYRTLTTQAQTELDIRPTTTARSKRPLTLTTTWLQRIDDYFQGK